MKKIIHWRLRLPILAALTMGITSERDSTYYPGYTNPNVENKMYWNDAFNVLEDLDQFSELYVKYENCIWSQYGNGEDEDGLCFNGDADEEENWYLGKTQCKKANVAYSLYGVLKEDAKTVTWGRNQCNKNNYINSFFTTHGVESFADPLGIDTTYANSYCTATQNDEGDNDCEDGEDCDVDYDEFEHNALMYSDFTSKGTGCSAKGRFVIDAYKGASCDGSFYEKTIDNLYSFNSKIEGLGCYKVYDSELYERRAEEDEEEEGYYEDDDSEEYSLAYQILSYSRSCSITEYPKGCPNPFGRKRAYSKALLKAAKAENGSGLQARTVFSWFFLIIGLFLMLLAVAMNRRLQKKLGAGGKRDRRNRKSWKFPKKIKFFNKKGAESTQKG